MSAGTDKGIDEGGGLGGQCVVNENKK